MEVERAQQIGTSFSNKKEMWFGHGFIEMGRIYGASIWHRMRLHDAENGNFHRNTRKKKSPQMLHSIHCKRLIVLFLFRWC